MSLFTKVFAVVLAFALLASSATAELVELNPENFDAIVKDSSKNVFVMFYAPWCGHCNSMKPAWLELADLFPASGDVVIARVDASTHRGIAKEFGISGFPTLKFFSKKDKSGKKQYEGLRDVENLNFFVMANKY
ncbi:hypothetical protein LSCM1_08015 [Leishmania martiniquensis]|uniref:Thioredoxin domain-containing protein n=1 Tax=Leishmania martiniquensis TaxID=1580590 RepID=A0A836H8G7_9TRYP|nr:hypothetical protein LSCM1_08015 [Leishmania martiniquensis]